jgi:glutaredoxin
MSSLPPGLLSASSLALRLTHGLTHGLALGLALGLFAAANVHAELYKWVGPDGKVTYSDVPPPSTAKQVERKAISAAESRAADLPYELAEAAKANPVTLYTAPKCVPCNQGRTLLNTRGIPFSEKTVTSNDDIERLRQAGGDTQLPLLLIGSSKQQGYTPDAWSAALSNAGYPETSKLPRTYRQPPAAAAAPRPTAAARPSAEEQAAGSPGDLPPPTGNAPPGFRF